MSTSAKGKGKETAAATAEPPRRRAVEGGQVIQTWADLGVADNAQRGYDQSKFEDAYRYVVYDLAPQEQARKEEAKAAKARDAEKLDTEDARTALETLLREFSLTRSQAESALLKNNLKLDDTIRYLIKPPDVHSNGRVVT